MASRGLGAAVPRGFFLGRSPAAYSGVLYYDFGFRTLGEIEMFMDLGTPPGRWKPGPEISGFAFRY
jgi:hypothetical protein